MSSSNLCLTTTWPSASADVLSTLLRQALIHRARRSPSEFAQLCFRDPLGRPLRQGQVHRDLQDFLSGQRRALVELPRDHGKSVQACIRVLWELGRDPSLRVKVVCASDERAAERCRFLRDALREGGAVRMVFPHLRLAQPRGARAFTVRRPVEVIGPSVAAFGVGTASTGSRADLLVCDDVVDVRSLRSAAERRRVKAYFHENLLNQLEPDGRLWCLFTPWHMDDLNGALKANPAYALFRRAVGDDLEPVWPEKWARDRLEERRAEIGAAAFARAYRLQHIPEEEVVIRPEWVRFWKDQAAPDRVVLSVDPAVSSRRGSDFSALVVVGRVGNEVRVLEATARRVAVPELIGLIDDADARWKPDVILFESNAAFEGIRELMVRQARFGPKVKAVVQTRDKASRVHGLSVPVENGTFRLKGGRPGQVEASQRGLFEELTTFPFGEHDDLLDAAATGTAYLLDRPEPRVW
jgi:phage terminase large subunit-like protein